MSIELKENPLITTLEQDLLGAVGRFPENLYVIRVQDDKYACNNATLSDGQVIDGLACFPSTLDAELYKGQLAGLDGETVGKSFEEARELTLSKPRLHAMLLFEKGAIAEIHFVR